jgi:Flp pilus assembly protein TadG
MKSEVKRQKSKVKNDVPAAGAALEGGTSFWIFDFCLLTFDLPLRGRRGTFSLQLLVVLVPVFFGLMGFAVDLGRLYLIRGELNQAAAAMALASANQLVGTVAATDNATNVANQMLDDSTGHGARYNFGANLLGQTTGFLASTVDPPSFFSTLADATGAGASSGTQADGTTARHVTINVNADAPLLFWSLLSLGQSRTTPIAATAVAGISAPLCVACGIQPFAVTAPNPEDPIDFGLGDGTGVSGTYYTFYYQCQQNPPMNQAPPALMGTILSYVLLDHYDVTNVLQDETQQLFAAGAGGLLGASTSNVNQAPVAGPVSCITINSTESIWGTNGLGNTTAQPGVCGNNISASVQNMLCGLYARMDLSQAPPTACTNAVTDAAALASVLQPDSDVADPGGDYSAYIGNGRRIITVPVVDSTMLVLGFRQFLLIPPPDGTLNLDPADRYGRFIAMYMGMNQTDTRTTPAPVRQGSIACPSTSGPPANPIQGPGKVVLHQ